jgi:CheY-like chemotaxis protein
MCGVRLIAAMSRSVTLTPGDVVELFVPIRTVAALAGLAVALQAIVQLPQQISDHIVPDAVAHRLQRLGEIAQAATGPQQRCLWIAARRRLDQTLQVGQQRGIGRGQLLAAAAMLDSRAGDEIILLLLDINMPGMSGLDLLPEVEECRPV